jgi:signal transduction histidine kinase
VLQRATELLGPNPDPALEPLLEEWDRQNQTRGLFAAARPRLLASETLRAPFVAPSATPGSLLLAAPAKVPSIQMPRLFWFTNREDSFWSASHQGMHKHSLVGRAMNRDLISQVTVPLEAGLSLDSNRDNGKEIPSPVQTRRIAREPFRDQDWLAIRTSEEKDGAWFVCRPRLNPEPFLDRLSDKDTSMTLVAWRASWNGPPRLSKEVLDPVMLEMAKFLQRVPEYFGVTLDVAGKTIVSSNQLPAISYVGGGKSGGHYSKQGVGGNPPELLAVAAKVEDGVPQLRVGVHLIGHDLLFSRQRSRTAWFGLLIAASAVAAIIGFVSARRAFQKQQRLAEMKSNFVSSVSHELRAPIASVRLMAEGLERGQVQDTAKQGEYFRFIVQECRRLSSLIENVLDFSRIEQGRKQYELEPTDLVALVRQTVKGMEPYAAERQIQLAVESLNLQSAISNLQPSVDGRAIQQALVNLIDNAIKHSPGGSTVTIGLESVGKAEGRRQKAESEVSPPAPAPAIQLWVEDTGEGIPPEEHERIFERFYRCGSELRRETQGVGIGLSIVKHIVEAHGGRVLVRSAVGEGSRFTIELPLKEVIE